MVRASEQTNTREIESNAMCIYVTNEWERISRKSIYRMCVSEWWMEWCVVWCGGDRSLPFARSLEAFNKWFRYLLFGACRRHRFLLLLLLLLFALLFVLYFFIGQIRWAYAIALSINFIVTRDALRKKMIVELDTNEWNPVTSDHCRPRHSSLGSS